LLSQRIPGVNRPAGLRLILNREARQDQVRMIERYPLAMSRLFGVTIGEHGAGVPCDCPELGRPTVTCGFDTPPRLGMIAWWRVESLGVMFRG
jgi:hypothetical protein